MRFCDIDNNKYEEYIKVNTCKSSTGVTKGKEYLKLEIRFSKEIGDMINANLKIFPDIKLCNSSGIVFVPFSERTISSYSVVLHKGENSDDWFDKKTVCQDGLFFIHFNDSDSNLALDIDSTLCFKVKGSSDDNDDAVEFLFRKTSDSNDGWSLQRE